MEQSSKLAMLTHIGFHALLPSRRPVSPSVVDVWRSVVDPLRKRLVYGYLWSVSRVDGGTHSNVSFIQPARY
jgi:hypothetical protein